ncbi:MAG: tautomerase family protein [Pseudomonadota bacterium]
MPSIDIQVLENVFTDEEKMRIIMKITDAFGEVAGETLKANTSVRIHEIRSGSWGYGGKVLTTSDAVELRNRSNAD